MAHLKLFVLGQPRVQCDGQPLNLNLRKALALLVYLAVSGQRHSRDALATMLWPESDGREGRARLRRTLHRLTQAIGDDILESEPEAIRLHPAANLWLDCAAFRQHVAAGLPAPTDPLALERLVEMQAAIELYADDFLAGFTLPDSPAFDEWQFFQRESLRQLYGQVLEQLVQAYRGQQAWYEAIAYARKWVALDGLHEPAHRALMRLYAWAGQQAAALRQYQECARILDVELGAAPEDETTALYDAIRTRQLAPPQATARKPGPTSEQSQTEPHQRYVVEERMAEGRQGEVYRGRDQLTGQPIAIKWLKTELAERHLDLIARFVREGAVLRRLSHPNIVGILDTFEHAGRYAIVMEYVPGGSLRTLLDTAGRLLLSQVLTLGLELADALSRAHHLGIIHRDLKPENVLLAADGTPRLTDFGLARWEQDVTTLTQSGTLFGSPAYMSPEAIRGEELDGRSDIWSLGVVLYELLAGRRPFEGAQITPVLASILEDPIPDLRQYRGDTPPALVELLGRMLVKERAQRLSSMRQVAAELEAIHAGRVFEGKLAEQPAARGTTPPARRVSALPVGLPEVSSSGAAEGAVFVAREQELSWLDGLFDAALKGQSQVAFIIGEAGQGKTALLQALASRAMQAHPDVIVAGGNCNAYTGTGDPYLPFREILELLSGDVEARALTGRLQRDHAERLWNSLPAAAQALLDVGPDLLDTFISARRLLSRAASIAPGAAWLPELRALADSKAVTPTNPRQQDLFEQYARVVQALAQRSPLLLILDDLQWADEGSTNLLLHLGRRLQGCPVLIVGAYRPNDVAMGRDGQRHPLERVVGELQRDLGEIVLDLSRAEGRVFVDALLDSEPNRLGETFRATLYQQTLGHPLFTIELLRDVQERGALARDEAGRWVAASDLDWSSLPARVEGAIGERVGRVDAPLRQLLQIASVEGEEFTAEVVARVLGADEHEIVRQLSRELAQTHQLVQALEIRRVETLRLSRYRFRHILIQRYLYGTLDHVERAYQHEAVGQALEALYGMQTNEVAAQLAWHFEVAQLPAKAAVYNEQAGDLARRSVALDAAIYSYQAALERWPALDRAGRARLLRKLGECQWLTGGLQDALATFEACHSLCESLGDREGAGAALRLIGRMYWEQGDREQSLQHYHRALALLEQGPESVELARAISSISQMYMLASDYGQAIAWGERVLALAERLRAESVIVHALNNMGVAYSMTGDLKRGEAMLRESLRRALDLRLPEDTCRAYRNLGSLLARLGRYAEAQATFEELQAYATRVHAPLFVERALLELTGLDWLAGRWREALSRRQQILEWLGRNQSIGYLEVTASTLFGWMHNDLGQPQAARQILEQELPKARSQAELQTTGPHLAQLVRALILLGMGSDATNFVHELLELVSQTPDFNPDNTVPLIFLCRWLAGSPTPRAFDDARSIMLALARADQQIGSPETAAALSEARGVLALSENDPARAVEQLRQAATSWQTLGRPYDQVRTLTDLGLALVVAGDAAEARTAFDRALSLVDTLAAQLDAVELKAAFLNSPLLQELHHARAALSATPVALHVPVRPGALRDDSPSGGDEGAVFVARDQELSWLGRRLDAALDGQHCVAFVVGEAGQGKTALLRTFAGSSQAAHPDLVVAWGSCNAYTGVGDPYLPFRTILELLTGNADVDALAGPLRPDYAARLRYIVPAATQALLDAGPDLLDTFIPTRPLLRRAIAYAGGGVAWVQQLHELVSRKVTRPSDPRQQDLFEQYARVVQNLTRHAPLLLILDDLQWADCGSADLLLNLGRRLKSCRVLIVGAYRPNDVAIGRGGERHPLEGVVGELQRDFGDIRLDLGRTDGRLFVDSLLDTEPNQLGEAFRAALYQQTEGHPLFTIELLRDMQERDALARDEAGRWVVAPSLDWSSLPARVEGAIGERVGRLDARLRELLQIASVEGEEFTAEVVARVLGADQPEIVRQLSRELDQRHHLVRALFVRRDDDVRLSRYRFRHILFQRYLYYSLDEVERVYQHEAVGQALEALHATRAAEIAAQLARHFEVAQIPAKASIYNAQAGDQARRSAALAEAVQYYQTALEIWPQSDLSGRAQLLRKLGECQWMRGRLQDALVPFEACYALYESLGDREGAGAVQRLLGRLYWEQGDREQSLQHYRRALALLEQGPESVELAWAISGISQMHMLASVYDQTISWGQRALAMAERLEAEHVTVPTLANMGNAYVMIGDAERGLAMLRRGWQRAVELNLPYDAGRIGYLLGERLTDLGRSAEARPVLEELQSYTARRQMPLHAGLATISLARLDWMTGGWQSALARRQKILAWIGRSQSISYLEVSASTTFAWMHNDLGQAEVARQMLEQAQPKVAGRAEIQTTGPYLGQQVRALGMLGFEDEAAEAAQQFLLIEQQQDYWDSTMPHLAVCRFFASRAPDMREELITSLALLERADTRLGSPATAAALSEGHGLVALNEQHALRAVDSLRQAAVQWQALGYPYNQMRVLVPLGRALSEAGAADEARVALDQALNLVDLLAAQLEDAEMRAAFLDSGLVQELHRARATLLGAT
jgi:predicted ATPase